MVSGDAAPGPVARCTVWLPSQSDMAAAMGRTDEDETAVPNRLESAPDRTANSYTRLPWRPSVTVLVVDQLTSRDHVSDWEQRAWSENSSRTVGDTPPMECESDTVPVAPQCLDSTYPRRRRSAAG